ncbi:nucleotidyltransferase family protein [Azohydromonas lata]|uniref:Nucleotidyltransferase family protein n=1 Tax=Azohydromonas lata TaxID=45677 RepID=A0ABU5ICJ1_9BURK|nr:nucleotidyltransferase family protein [Azohydromonas lata]MDZ5456534.1 nucleotidyltransferase family protein [Azohydromonas lata]
MKPWESVLVGPQASLHEAISALDKGALQIAIVVDEQRRILGSLTDGDVRRALLRQVALTTPVAEVMHRHPHTMPASSSPDQMLALMESRRLLQIPLVDELGRIVGLQTLHELLQSRHRANAVFLMAGGFGKRLQPLTDHCPKPLLKVGDKPILELIIEGFVKAGFHRFFISTHYRPEMIRDGIGDGSRWGVSVEYVHEDQPLGTGGALGLLPHEQIQEPLFMMNGDLLTNLDFAKLLQFHDEHDGVATMCVREYEHRVPYGVIETDGLRITSMVEKPAYRHFINAGIYVLSPEVVHAVAPGRQVDMPTLLQEHMDSGRPVNMFPLHEYWLDIGRMEDFQRAQAEVTGLFHG